VHNKPLFSQTVELAHMYQNPLAQLVTTGGRLTPAQEQHIKKEVSPRSSSARCLPSAAPPR
jgi:hypothetical protein